MLRTIVRKTLRIEFLLIYGALAIFFCTIYFKSASNAQIQRLDQDMLLLQMDGGTGGEPLDIRTSPREAPEGIVRRLQDDYEPYTYFDPALKESLAAVTAELLAGERSAETIIDFQDRVHRAQNRLNLGYDSLMYSSLLLIAVGVGAILEKFFRKSIQVERLKTMQGEQAAFGRDLHDGVAQNLAALKIYLEKEDIPKSKFYAKQALDEIRYMIGAGGIDFSKDFATMLREVTGAFEANFGIETRLYLASEKAAALDEGTKTHLMRILQEALSNIARHADASLVEVRLVDGIDDFRLVISDNGKGFAAADVERRNKADGTRHYGLLNIKKRAQLIGARVDFMTDGGSTIAVTVKDSLR